jgi:NADPH-dependent 7-cyano-7-deazaguanine reductase QueF
MTERADQLHHDNAPAHSATLVQASLTKHYITQVCQPALQPRFGSLRLLAYPKTKITVEREEICECDGHTVHKLSQRHLTAD